MWLLLLMIYVMPFETSPYLKISDSFLGIFDSFTVIKLLGLIGFAWAGLKMANGEADEPLLDSSQSRLFLLFYAGVLFAGLLSGSGFLAISRYLAFLTFMPFVLVTVRTHDDLRRVVYAIALTYVVVFPYAVRQMLRFGGRLGTGLYETNYFAANVLLVIPLVLVIARQQVDPFRRKLWMAAALVLVLALFLTASRGGFLGLIAATAVYAYRRRGFVGAAALIVVLLFAALALPTGLGQRAAATLGDAGDVAGLEASNRAHTALFWAGLRMIADAPLTGVGPLNFKELSVTYARDLERPYMAHNSYLEIAAELGLPVLGVFLLLIWRTFRGFGRAATLVGDREAAELAGWADGFRSGLIGFIVAGAFISAQYEKMFWIVVFLSIVVERLATRRRAAMMAGEAPALAGDAPPLLWMAR
jgi:O-antigen ligase